MFNNNQKFAFEKLNKMIGAVLKPLKILLNLKNISFFKSIFKSKLRAF
jgi:hypothetical protein